MNTNSVDTTSLFNNFSHFGGLGNVSYKIDERGTQFIEIKHPDNFIIVITVPDRIFEWFIVILDSERTKLVSDWDDGYGEPKEILIANRQKAVEEFIHDILNQRLRFVFEKKRFKEISRVEIFNNNSWAELISNKRFTLL